MNEQAPEVGHTVLIDPLELSSATAGPTMHSDGMFPVPVRRGNRFMNEFDPSHYSVTARWVFPVSSPPIEQGVIEIAGGQIVAVHNHHDPRAVNLGNVALIPGLVNTHTHLEFSDLAEPVQPALPFTKWIRSLVSVRRASPATRDVVQQGLAECHVTGTAAVGEIATQDWSDADYSHPRLRVTAFREVIGLRSERIAAQLETARNWLTAPQPLGNFVTRGLSPHAPYSVHPDLYRDLIHLAAEHRAPVAIHLAETTSELELLSRGTGEFIEMLKRFNAWDDQSIPTGTRPLDYIKPLSAITRGLIIHGNYLQGDEIDWLAQHPQVSVIYCPRTHAFFRHPPHPWLQLLERGVNVALGTDSRGSNPDLSMWREMQFLVDHFPQIDPTRILAMGTLAGAQALGQRDSLGSLEPGKSAILAIVDVSHSREDEPHRLLFAASGATQLAMTS